MQLIPFVVSLFRARKYACLSLCQFSMRLLAVSWWNSIQFSIKSGWEIFFRILFKLFGKLLTKVNIFARKTLKWLNKTCFTAKNAIQMTRVYIILMVKSIIQIFCIPFSFVDVLCARYSDLTAVHTFSSPLSNWNITSVMYIKHNRETDQLKVCQSKVFLR